MRRFKPKLKHNKVLSKKVKKGKRSRLLKELKEKGFVRHKNSNSYVSGLFWSTKNNKEYIFRSTYEFAYFFMLENDGNVESYIVEPFDILYRSPKDNRIHRYIPDIIVLYKDGSLKIIEIKPKCMTTDPVVVRKAEAARKYIKHIKMQATYEFITEEDIFLTNKDYVKLKNLLMKDEKGLF